MELTKQLLEFRSVYMRAIAKAWNNDDFRQKLCAENNALNIFKEYFEYNCPWNITFTINDKCEGPFYNSLRGVYMTSALSFDRFLVYVPKLPDIPHPVDAISDYYLKNTWLLEQKCEKDLHQDLTQLNTFLDSLDNLSTQQTNNTPVNEHISEGAGDYPVNFMRIPESSYNLGNSDVDFTNFGGVMLSALSLAWSNKVFKEKFITSELTEEQPIGTAAVLLKEWLNYDYPWDVDLVVKEDDNAHYARTFSATVTLKGGTQHHCKVAFKLNNENYNLQLNELVTSFDDYLFSESHSISKDEIESISIESNTIPLDQWVWCQEIAGNYSQIQKTSLGIVLSLPEAPDSKDAQPVALTRYNNDGSGFPFTC
ncbi:hypothetical protein CWC18_13700 [Pseudoalteromonas aurantia]|uniref:BMA_0021/BMA_0022 family TOMM bacteriocin n=1 Tax=Pseudoalteromonas aurantia TaxID=43654 RepID=UPI00110B6FB2|nr:BMA_0021/BMA_0022 family TOMM bacteriocin [Pseudoalteromonas aurantia]TMO60462.1 hypothetical protein CWC18_13700 [Pseudoalteromonas aurantia]